MARSTAGWPVLVALALVCGCATANVVLEWNSLFLDTLKASAPDWEAGRISRATAMLHLAIADAIEQADRLPANSLRGVTRGVALETAAAYAAHDVLAALLPSSSWDVRLRAFVLLVSPSTANGGKAPWGFEEAARVGSLAARRVLDSRMDDLSNSFVFYSSTAAPGRWQPTPPQFREMPQTPAWRLVKPFTGLPHEHFEVERGPPDLFSREYAAAVALTQELGARDSPTRTEEQTQIAYFWADSTPGSDSRPAHWNRIFAAIAVHAELGIQETARFFRVLNVALADVAIGDKVNKFKFDQWRPVTAIRNGIVGNPYIRVDRTWTPLLDTENSQEYPSSHAACAAAAVHVIAKFLPNLNLPAAGLAVTSDSPNSRNVVRVRGPFPTPPHPIPGRRIYAGNHFAFSVEMGRALGTRAGEAAWAHHQHLAKGRTPSSASLHLRWRLIGGYGEQNGGGAEFIKELETDALLWVHEKTGAELLSLLNDDEGRPGLI